MSDSHVVVLAIDGLRASALGAYGNTTYPTPAFDRLACQSLLYDFALADSSDLLEVYDFLFQSIELDNHRHSVLIADDPAITSSPVAERFIHADALTPEVAAKHAPTLDDTVLAKTLGEIAAQLTFRLEQSPNDRPLLAWLHCSGLNAPWDAPPELAESLLGEEDEPIASTDTTPATDVRNKAGDADWPDAVFHASCRYAGQVMTLDACLEGFVAFLDELFADEPYTLIVTGLRGYALGEHGRIGGDDARLYWEMYHVPLMVRDSTGQQTLVRNQTACNLSQALASKDVAISRAIQTSPTGERAIHNGDWRLIQPSDSAENPQLFLKPDDRWEQNDVASLRPGVVDDLTAMLAEADRNRPKL